MDAKANWIEDGDRILDAIELLVSGEIVPVEANAPSGRQWLWRRLTSTAFKVQYMMAATEVRLDSLERGD